MLKKLAILVKSPKILYLIGGIIIILYILFLSKKESFDTEIDQNKQEYDDALEQRIDEVKKEIPGSDAELLLDVNRPYNADNADEKGWFGDVINCKNNGDLEIYCRPKDKWIWPY